MMKPNQFKFERGPLSAQLTLERMESLRRSCTSNTPSPSGHVGLRILQTENGWVGIVAQPTPQESIVRTFFVRRSGPGQVSVSAGAINNVVVAADTYAVSDGDGVYIRATVDGDGFVTAVGIEILDPPPTDTETDGWTVLASVEVDGGAVTVTPLAWNYSQVQKCGPTTYLWGGFGGH